MRISQKYGFNEMISFIPIINYQGILYKFASRDTISLEKIFLKTVVIESSNLDVSMHFYTQNDILIAHVTGIHVDEELVKKTLEKINCTSDR